MLIFLERGFNIDSLAVWSRESFLDDCPVRLDLELPLLELSNFALLLGNDDLNERLVHPGRLPQEFVPLLLQGLFGNLSVAPAAASAKFLCMRPHFSGFSLPAWNNAIVHSSARDLVDAYEHHFAGFPSRSTVFDKVVSNSI